MTRSIIFGSSGSYFGGERFDVPRLLAWIATHNEVGAYFGGERFDVPRLDFSRYYSGVRTHFRTRTGNPPALFSICFHCGRRSHSSKIQTRNIETVPQLIFHECPACGKQVYGPAAMAKIETHRGTSLASRGTPTPEPAILSLLTLTTLGLLSRRRNRQ